MTNKKFDIILTIILSIILVAVFVLVGFWGYDLIQKTSLQSNANHAVDEFNKLLEEAKRDRENNNQNGAGNDSGSENGNPNAEQDEGQSDETSGEYYGDDDYYYGSGISYQDNGFNVVGTIEIPKLDLRYPVYDVATISSMEHSVGIIHGPGLNKPGNTVIMGHNYRNGTLFSDNKYLSVGDIIYITDTYGQTLQYNIYNVYTTSTSDFDYAIRETNGQKEITLASCTDDSSSRLIIWARAE